jgi:hypothetical protein
MDELTERLMQEALHPARRTRRISLEPDAHDDGSEELHFDSGQMDTVIRLTPVDLDELTEVLLARREPGIGATAAEVRDFLASVLTLQRVNDDAPPGTLARDVNALERVISMLGEA